MSDRQLQLEDLVDGTSVVDHRVSTRVCAWCRSGLRETARAGAIYCSTRCRQAAWRFRRDVQVAAAAATPKRVAYADPPYPGLSYYYVGHHDYAGEVDHIELLENLQEFDGWALSTNADSLQLLLGHAADLGIEPRIASWFRGARPGSGRRARNAWEPVLYSPERSDVSSHPGADALVHVSRPRTTDPGRVIGTKPAAFCGWLFADLLRARAGDELVDLFPGSGGVTRAWEIYTSGAEASDASRRSI
jgi:hypothetical protein